MAGWVGTLLARRASVALSELSFLHLGQYSLPVCPVDFTISWRSQRGCCVDLLQG